MESEWLWLIAGLLIAWTLYWLLDTFVWKTKRVCREIEDRLKSTVSNLEIKNESLQTDVNNQQATLADYTSQVRELNGSVDFHKQEVAQAQLNLDSKNVQLDAIKKRIPQLEEVIATRDVEITELNGKITVAEEDLLNKTVELRGLTQTHEILQKQSQEKDEAIVALQGSLSEKETQFGDLQTQHLLLESNVAENVTELSDVKGQLSAAVAGATITAAGLHNKDSALEGVRIQNMQLEASVLALEGELQEMRILNENQQKTLHSYDTELSRLSAEVSNKSTSISSLDSQFALLQTNLSAHDSKLTDTTIVLEARNVELEAFRLELAQLQSDVAVKDGMVAGLRSQLNEFDTQVSDWRVQSAEDKIRIRQLGDELNLVKTDLENVNFQLNEKENTIRELSQTPDDLTKIYGIGPKFSALLQSNEIHTYDQLANIEPAKIEKLIDESGMNFALSSADMHASWTTQAAYASNENWHGLQTYWDSVKDRNITAGLTKIWGIGSKTEADLNAQGITSYAELEVAPFDQCESCIADMSEYYPALNSDEIYREVIDQARLANSHKWSQLKGYQERYRVRRANDDFSVLWEMPSEIEEILHKRGIYQYEQLASISPEYVQKLYDEANLRPRISYANVHKLWTAQSVAAQQENTNEVARLSAEVNALLKPENFKKIEGIGPKINGLLNRAGVYTFAQLSQMDVADLKQILTDAGPRYSLADPTTWPKQAELAAAGKWDELAKWQDELDGGRL